MKDKAIFNLYPNITQIEEIDGVFVCKDKDMNIVEVSDWNAVDTKLAEMQTELDNKKTQEKADKVSGNQKLLDLGLTQAEATALTGYKPE